jgi:calcium/calmodulin-dependent protein kinase I
VQSKKPYWWVKIGDFGISKRAEEGLTAFRTFGGTPGFIAPEILVQHGLFDDSDFRNKGEYTVAVDIWSLGEISFRALTGEQPFPIGSLRKYVRGASPFPIEMLQTHNVSEEGCNFLISLMAPMPEDRLTAKKPYRMSGLNLKISHQQWYPLIYKGIPSATRISFQPFGMKLTMSGDLAL